MWLTAVPVLGALALDWLFEEPPERYHPVAILGRAVGPLDREWRRPAVVGTLVAVLIPLCVALLTGASVWVVGQFSQPGTIALATLVVFSTTSLFRLLRTGRRIGTESERALAAARNELPALVGRDPTTLDAVAVRSAVIESLAENLADGLIAPLVGYAGFLTIALLAGFGLPGTLALACAGAAWMKAVNTLDSMVGYPHKPVGWASAVLDDLVMWVPARLTAGVIALTSGKPALLGRARAWRAEPASPNSGWPMATLAVVLDVRLEKEGAYILHPRGAEPTVGDVMDVYTLLRRAGIASFLAVAGYGGLIGGVGPWS